jgi:hypothetical protein
MGTNLLELVGPQKLGENLPFSGSRPFQMA